MDREPKPTQPIAVVTGASSGIGFELAKIFAINGFDLLITAEDDGIVDAANRLGVYGRTIEFVQLDLASFDGVEELCRHIRNLGQPIDSVAINAGVGVSGDFISTNLAKEINLINLNVISSVHLAKNVLQDMVAVGHGRILFTSSVAAEMPGPYYAVYAASKAFIQSFAEALRHEVQDKGVTITAMQPGATDTNFFARAGMLDTKAGQAKKDDPAEVARDGFKALMANKDHVVAGSFKNVIQANLSRFMSEPQAAAAQGQSTKPESDKHH